MRKTDVLSDIRALERDVEKIRELGVRKRKARSRVARPAFAQMSLMQFIVAVADFGEDQAPMEPHHLKDLVDGIEKANIPKPIRLCLSIPPQHGKTTTILCGIVWMLLHHPSWRIAYLSGKASMSQRWRTEIERMLTKVGFEIYQSNVNGIRVIHNGKPAGQILLRGFRNPVVGEKLNAVFVDDPHRDMLEALSPTLSRQTFDIFNGSILTRAIPGESSFFVVHQRLAASDLIGQLEKFDAWEVVNMPAVNPDGSTLWPERWSFTELERRRLETSEYIWATQYLGKPATYGAEIFSERGVKEKELPDVNECDVVYGIDVAYKLKAHNDFSAIVEMWHHRPSGEFYVPYVWRGKVPEETFCTHLKGLVKRRNATIWFVGSPLERSTAERFKSEYNLPLRFRSTNQNKYERARMVAVAWNGRSINLPPEVDWDRDTFLGELLSFQGTGAYGTFDDQVDALSTAFEALRQPNTLSLAEAWEAGKGLIPQYNFGSGLRFSREKR